MFRLRMAAALLLLATPAIAQQASTLQERLDLQVLEQIRAEGEQRSAEMARTSAYLNVDNGTGRLRGVYGQGNRAAMQIIDQIMLPFRNVGVVASTIDNTSATDHLSFDRAGIPGFQFIQDPIEYDERTHHTSVDAYERLVLADLKQAAQIVAFTVYTIANRDEMIPRKTPRAMGTN